MSEIVVKHDSANKQFVYSKDDLDCVVKYDILKENPLTVDFYKTFVHDAFRGQGVAGALMKAASEWALKENVKVVPTCSYSVVYYKKYKKYSSILADEADLNNAGSCRI